ncbi:RING finger protein [Candidatus Dependentiae bacterium]|nr:RING finger protein [Candidatus Dependentiae bacterium]
MWFFRRAKLFLVVAVLVVPQVCANSEEEQARKVLALGDAAFSIAGDALVAKYDKQHEADGLRLVGSLCNMIGNYYNPYMQKNVRLARLVSDGARSFAHASTVLGENQKENKKIDCFASGVLRFISLGSEWFAIKKEYAHHGEFGCNEMDKEDKKDWAFAKLVSSWSRALADGLSVTNKYAKAFSCLSATVDSYELAKELDVKLVKGDVQPVKTWDEQLESVKSFFINMNPEVDFKTEYDKRFNDGRWDKCLVCFDDKIQRKNLAMYPCGHVFCKACIKNWRGPQTDEERGDDDQRLDNKNCCPVCRRMVKDDEILH